jgi:ATP/maltotriose-dependent transcriptional regulator MalT
LHRLCLFDLRNLRNLWIHVGILRMPWLGSTMSELAQQPMTVPDDLLRTKLAPPRLDTACVPRAALLARIDAGLSRKLTLIAAPAGFGKTTLLAEWLASNDERGTRNDEAEHHRSSFIAHHSHVAWVSLDAGDNDPVRFWRYLLSACRAWDQAVGKASLAALRTAQQPSIEMVLIPFINEVARLPSRCILVIEDYHHITTPEIYATLAFLIEHLPSNLHIILTTRGNPDLPLARLRARNELTELTAEDLRFSRAEIQTFLDRTLHVALSPEVLARLEQRTEGWAAGLRLVALALQHTTDASAVEQALATFSGGHRHVIEYLVSEVLAVQPEPLQTFLLSSCFLSRLTGSLCDATTDRGDSTQLLEQLERENLFLVPLDSGDGQLWYRYHPLFAEALRQYARQQLGENHVRLLHERAGAWCEAHGMLHDAVEEAIAAGQASRAATLIEGLFDRGGFNELYTFCRWIEQLPSALLPDHPLLCFVYANAVLFTTDRYAPATARTVEQWAQIAEAAWRKQQNTARLGQVAALRSMVAFWQGDTARSFACARRALELLDEHDLLYRSISLLHAGHEQLLAGQIDAAQRLTMEAYTLFEINQNIHGTLAATMLLGDLCYQQAEIEPATHYYQQVLDAAVGGEEMLDDQGYSLCGLSAIAYERDDLGLAEQQAIQAGELAKQRHFEALRVQAALILGQVQHARGQTAQARHELQVLAAQIRKPALLREIQGRQALLALAMDDLEAAQRWHAAVVAQSAPASHMQEEREALTIARLHIAQGDPQAALDLLKRARADATANGRTRSEVEILALQALAHSALADGAAAVRALTRALTLGQPRGLRRTFLDLGEPLAMLVRTAAPDLTRRSLAAYAATLLRALTTDQAGVARAVALPLLEPLSPQEQRILRMIVAGRSNPEIARELVVSANTVKTHIKNIYRKLNVGTRAEAQAAARELHLR